MTPPQVICLGEALVDRLGPIGGGANFEKYFNDYLGGAPAINGYSYTYRNG